MGFDEVRFGTVEYANLKLYNLYFYVAVRVDKVQELENLAHDFSTEDAHLKTVTSNVNCGTLIGQHKFEFDIRSPEDVENAVGTFWEIYNEHAIEHIKKCYDIDYLNSLWPTYGLLQTNGIDIRNWLTIYGWYHKVLTIAYLANPQTFPQFREEFINYLVNERNFPDDVRQKLDEYLDKITA